MIGSAAQFRIEHGCHSVPATTAADKGGDVRGRQRPHGSLATHAQFGRPATGPQADSRSILPELGRSIMRLGHQLIPWG
jgi:hypothetical protein